MTLAECIAQVEEIIALGRSGVIGEKDIEALNMAVNILRGVLSFLVATGGNID